MCFANASILTFLAAFNLAMRTHPAERRVGPGLYEIKKIKRSLLSPCQAM
ncbi:MAG: hypothetical protein BWZ07_02010 [Alphaproteobacteria bacterium ADurb.BinA280]|nr:MAG: hypothetical protein BWZ07_02010 [Alphaproteobacteria bacterium ADurb.BinA280]